MERSSYAAGIRSASCSLTICPVGMVAMTQSPAGLPAARFRSAAVGGSSRRSITSPFTMYCPTGSPPRPRLGPAPLGTVQLSYVLRLPNVSARSRPGSPAAGVPGKTRDSRESRSIEGLASYVDRLRPSLRCVRRIFLRLQLACLGVEVLLTSEMEFLQDSLGASPIGEPPQDGTAEQKDGIPVIGASSPQK
jgi:hypothetical protein